MKALKASSFKQTVSYLDDSLKYGIKPGLERIKLLLDELGNPQDLYKTILITGTNGKTSTSKTVYNLLLKTGKAVGLYISPHLNSYCERISICGQDIEEQDLAKNLDEIKPAIERVNYKTKDNLTNFEIFTALAFNCFANKKVDYAVLEVGMGARFDATCLVSADVSIITNIEMDHVDILGSTIKKIAKEKSYVVKEGGCLVVGNISAEARSIIEDRVRKTNAQSFYINEEFFVKKVKKYDEIQKIDIRGILGEYKEVEIGSIADYQAQNVCLAVAAVESFVKKALSRDQIKAIKKISFDGRLEVIKRNPMVIVDGAHNVAAARELKKIIKRDLKFAKLILILAIYKDKDYAGIVRELASVADRLIITENRSSRCLRASEFAKATKDYERIVIEDLEDAINEAYLIAKENDIICITGSLATVADAKMIIGKS